MIPRLVRWYDERPVTGDACLAGVLLLAFVLPSDVPGGAVDVAFSVALLACVPFRRVAPVAAFVAAACCVWCSSPCPTTSWRATSSR